MITMYIGGGLANKMFQYAFSLGIKKRGFQVGYDTHTFKTEFVHDRVSMSDIFPNITMPESDRHFVALGKSSKLFRIFKRLSSYYIVETAYQYNDRAYSELRNGCVLEGSWQDERYFRHAADEVTNAFEFKPFEDSRNIEITKQMVESNSVAIHVRKGDGYGTWNILANTCPKSYYDDAINYIKKHVENPKFFVFSDSPETAKDYLDLNGYTIINWNPTNGKGNYLDMQLMSCAKHNVIANSTYSWWGAWLNQNPRKIVVGPKYWFNPQCKWADINHVVSDDWIKL